MLISLIQDSYILFVFNIVKSRSQILSSKVYAFLPAVTSSYFCGGDERYKIYSIIKKKN